jgi:hypothetical protein
MIGTSPSTGCGSKLAETGYELEKFFDSPGATANPTPGSSALLEAAGISEELDTTKDHSVDVGVQSPGSSLGPLDKTHAHRARDGCGASLTAAASAKCRI